MSLIKKYKVSISMRTWEIDLDASDEDAAMMEAVGRFEIALRDGFIMGDDFEVEIKNQT